MLSFQSINATLLALGEWQTRGMIISIASLTTDKYRIFRNYLLTQFWANSDTEYSTLSGFQVAIETDTPVPFLLPPHK